MNKKTKIFIIVFVVITICFALLFILDKTDTIEVGEVIENIVPDSVYDGNNNDNNETNSNIKTYRKGKNKEIKKNDESNFSFSGYSGKNRTFYSDSQSYCFYNMENNILSETFVIYYNDKEVWRSGLVAPGEQANWCPLNDFSNNGTYTVTLIQTPYFDNGTAANTLNQELNFTIKK